MFDWLRQRRPPRPIPDGLWQDVVQAYAFISALQPGELSRLRELASRFLETKEFHGAQGLVISDRVALSITVQAVLPVLNLGLSWYDDFVGIVVHPDEVVARRSWADADGVVHNYEEVLAGEAMEGGPVMVNWRDAQDADASAAAGYNVVIHEFIHKIDMRDGQPDGCPPLPTRAARDQWLQVLQAEFESFREKTVISERFGGETPWLDAYGATSIDEFFAVACEAYFVNRPRFEQEFPYLTPLFSGFFGI